MSLSQRLRAARNERGLTLESASAKSNVALRYVRMLEEGNYPMVADPVYLTSFLRRYAACLGLNELQASREFIAETVNSPAEMPGVAWSKPPVEGNDTHTNTAEQKSSKGLQPPLIPSRRMARARVGKCSSPVGSRTGRSRPRLFKFYAGPLTVIMVVWTVGPLSPLNHWIGKTPPRVSVMESHQEPSAVLIATSTEPSQEPDPASASPALASRPPTTELSPSPVEAPLPAAMNPQAADLSTSDHQLGAIESEQKRSTIDGNRSATDKASDELRAEQLARMKTRSVSANASAKGAGGA